MRIQIFLLPILLLFSFISCQKKEYTDSDKVEQRLIFQHYTLTYDQHTGTFSATAGFTLNNLSGTSLMLTKRSNISLNDILLESKITASGSCHYPFEKKMDFPKTSVFKYVNHDGEMFENKIKLSLFELKDPLPTRISKSAGIHSSFEGDLFEEDELLFCHFYQNEELIYTLSLESPSGRSFSIFPIDLEEVASGDYAIQFLRNYESSDVESMDRGGWCERTYLSKMYNITIVN